MDYLRKIGYTLAVGLTTLYMGCATAPERREEQKLEQRPRQEYRMADSLRDNPTPLPARNCPKGRAFCLPNKSFMEKMLDGADESLFRP